MHLLRVLHVLENLLHFVLVTHIAVVCIIWVEFTWVVTVIVAPVQADMHLFLALPRQEVFVSEAGVAVSDVIEQKVKLLHRAPIAAAPERHGGGIFRVRELLELRGRVVVRETSAWGVVLGVLGFHCRRREEGVYTGKRAGKRVLGWAGRLAGSNNCVYSTGTVALVFTVYSLPGNTGHGE